MHISKSKSQATLFDVSNKQNQATEQSRQKLWVQITGKTFRRFKILVPNEEGIDIYKKTLMKS